MKELYNILTNYLKSFNNLDEGYSRKKCAAYLFGVTTVVLELMHTNKDNLILVLGANIAFIGVLYGIKAYEQSGTPPNTDTTG